MIVGQEAIISAVIEALSRRDDQKETSTIAISRATRGKATNLFRRVGFVCIAPPAPFHIQNIGGGGYPPFVWGNRTEPQGTPDARDYLQARLESVHADFANTFQLVDTHSSRSVLSFSDANIGNISGGTDLVICPLGTMAPSLSSELNVVIELKTSENFQDNIESFYPSIQVEFVSANCLSNQPGILAVLTDLATSAIAWKSVFDSQRGHIVVYMYEGLSIAAMCQLVSDHLTDTAVLDPAFVPAPNSNDANAQRSLAMKRKFEESTGFDSDALAQFEVMAEGTAPWSRERGQATWDLLRTAGVERMPALVHHSMYC